MKLFVHGGQRQDIALVEEFSCSTIDGVPRFITQLAVSKRNLRKFKRKHSDSKKNGDHVKIGEIGSCVRVSYCPMTLISTCWYTTLNYSDTTTDRFTLMCLLLDIIALIKNSFDSIDI